MIRRLRRGVAPWDDIGTRPVWTETVIASHQRQVTLLDFAFAAAFRQNAMGAGPRSYCMWYFAYGSNLNARAVAEWCRHHGHRPPQMKGGRPGVLDNYRLCFPIYSEYWGGGIGDIIYDPGKYVAGALFDLNDAELKLLDAKVDRRTEGEKEMGTYKRIEVKIAPLARGEPVMALTYQGVNIEKYHIPPTQHYMDLVVQGAYSHGLSMMWISYLHTFSIQQGRMPRPPGAADSSR